MSVKQQIEKANISIITSNFPLLLSGFHVIKYKYNSTHLSEFLVLYFCRMTA